LFFIHTEKYYSIEKEEEVKKWLLNLFSFFQIIVIFSKEYFLDKILKYIYYKVLGKLILLYIQNKNLFFFIILLKLTEKVTLCNK